jgi:hypothetical protein
MSTLDRRLAELRFSAGDGPVRNFRMSRGRRFLIWLVLAPICIGTVASCSTFERDWQERRQVAVAPGAFQGCWEGTWTSDWNGHSGKLRAIITPISGARYNVRFHAVYDLLFAPLTFEYEMPMEIQRHGNAILFKGSADLGVLAGGEFMYDGACRGDIYRSDYDSSLDHGVFEMRRPRYSLSR